MNELQLAEGVRRALDESSRRLDPHVINRLAAARRAALERMPIGADVPRFASLPMTAPARERTLFRFGWQAAAVAAPLAALVLGVFAIVSWSDGEDAVAQAEIDAAVLTDDVPIAAYADKGFGVYLANWRQ